MSKGKNQHVVPISGGGWGVRGENNSKLTSKHDTKADAIKAGKEIATNQHSELITHRQDGRIQSKDSYGNDPNPPKDTEH